MDLLLESNPRRRFMFNPRRRHRRSRNPVAALTHPLETLTGGVPITDIAAGVGGLAAVTMVPGLIIRNSTTTSGKILKVVVSLGIAVGASYIAKQLGASASKAALIGGLSGVGVQAINMLKPGTIGQGPMLLGRGISEGALVSPAMSRGEEHVGVILP